MIVLDTNVLSETLRPAPDALALTWLAQQPRSALFTTTVTRAELLYGVRLLPDGQRKAALMEAIHGIFASDMAGQVLGFDNDASDAYAEIAALRKLAGKPISQFDAMIAAIAKSRGASLATRNVKDFVDCGITVIDPWKR
ncbi:type II toxin-antitoxin system VapC family toxin [Enterobacter hormaechei]|uniref:Ribonuclease VapC n=1 Tax=Enterobacter ludwigii TaxID=299767 RepID=A0AAX3LIU5_9ENTR|nr:MULTISPECIES: type II toxin-antitoxin system VapC family toxin [Enterobacteriaceae]EKS6729951.1 type II toxin-antitoxin system VapC family toxin [Enterobacter mori]EES0030212.1 type II toxin-antitoxin system VapC family toxin [Escherichia coli]MBX8911130.1 type II toxin-antitoxin system VapC family toxin [Enterobacter ludwigii]MCD9354826.1 type II toxin-antitoxin system VapC family toxin [Klebsiella pneumoniae]MCD9375855.1 type II toxin-antitoxin system VapC family toxin [Klebsiella pneumon